MLGVKNVMQIQAGTIKINQIENTSFHMMNCVLPEEVKSPENKARIDLNKRPSSPKKCGSKRLKIG